MSRVYRPIKHTVTTVKVKDKVKDPVLEAIKPGTVSEYEQKLDAYAKTLTRYDINANTSRTGKRASPVLIAQVQNPSRKGKPLEDPFWVSQDLAIQAREHTGARVCAISCSFVPTVRTLQRIKQMTATLNEPDNLPVITATGARYHWASGTQAQDTQMAHNLPASIIINGRGPETFWPLLSFQAETIRCCYGSGTVLPTVVNRFDSLMENNSGGTPGLRELFAIAQRQMAMTAYTSENPYQMLPLMLDQFQEKYIDIQERRIARVKDQYASTNDSDERRKYDRLLEVGESGLDVLMNISMRIPPDDLAILDASFNDEAESSPRIEVLDDNTPSSSSPSSGESQS